MLTIEEIREFLATNKDDEKVKAFMTEITPKAQELTAELVSPWLETPEGQKLVQPYGDRRVNDAIKTHEEKMKKKFDSDLKMAVDAEMLKRNPQETPAERNAREAKEETEKIRAEMEDERKQRRVEKTWLDSGMKPKFVKYLSKLSEDEVGLFMKEFSGELTELDKKVRTEFAATSHKPGSGNSADGKGKIDLKSLSQEQVMKLELEGKLDDAIRNQ
jgi:hypothetical protein